MPSVGQGLGQGLTAILGRSGCYNEGGFPVVIVVLRAGLALSCFKGSGSLGFRA